MKIVAGMLIVIWLPGAALVHGDRADAPCPTMLLATTAAQSSPGTRDVASPDGRVVHVTVEPLLTRKDFVSANVTRTEGQFVLNVGLTPSSSKRWVDFTARSVGSRVAFIVDEMVVKTPTIKDPNTGSGLLLGPFLRAEAQKIADAINRKCDAARGIDPGYRGMLVSLRRGPAGQSLDAP